MWYEKSRAQFKNGIRGIDKMDMEEFVKQFEKIIEQEAEIMAEEVLKHSKLNGELNEVTHEILEKTYTIGWASGFSKGLHFKSESMPTVGISGQNSERMDIKSEE